MILLPARRAGRVGRSAGRIQPLVSSRSLIQAMHALAAVLQDRVAAATVGLDLEDEDLH